MHDCAISRLWLNAEFRIVFSKSRSDEAAGYALRLDTLIDVLPPPDKDLHCRRGNPLRQSVPASSSWRRGRVTRAAQALRLDRRAADGKAGILGERALGRRDIVILHLDHPAACAADQELRRMGVAVTIGVAVGIGGASCDTADESR